MEPLQGALRSVMMIVTMANAKGGVAKTTGADPVGRGVGAPVRV